MEVLMVPDPRLHEVAQPVDLKTDKSIKHLAKQMARLMYKTGGVGLAAPQVGVSKRLVVIDCHWHEDGGVKDPIYLVNPEIIYASKETQTDCEGCLSVPGIWVELTRAMSVKVRAQDLDGETYEYEATGFDARAFQHEIDHLEGKTMFERLDPVARIDALKQYEDAIARGARPGHDPED